MKNHFKFNIQFLDQDAIEPVAPSVLKSFIRLESDGDDQLLSQIIKAARIAAESYLGLSLISREIQVTYSGHIDSKVTLFYGPVKSINSVVIFPANNISFLLPDRYRRLEADNRTLVLSPPVYCTRLVVSYKAGFGKREDIPEAIVQGLLMHSAVLYESRMGERAMPVASAGLYNNFKVIKV